MFDAGIFHRRVDEMAVRCVSGSKRSAVIAGVSCFRLRVDDRCDLSRARFSGDLAGQ